MKIENNNSKIKNETIPTSMKFGYGVGDVAFNIAHQTVALFLIFFFTDVFGIGALAAGSIVLFSKIWDAITDPLMGIACDHTKTRWGKKRPYLLFGALPLGLSFFLLFASPNLSGDMRFIYALATFVFFCTAITVTNVPYGSLTAALTLDSKERSNISGYRVIFAILGTLIAAGATMEIVGLFPDKVVGFRMIGAIYAVVIVVILLITFLTVKERVVPKEEVKQPFLKNFKVVISNKPFVILTIATFLFMVSVNLPGAVVSYYFKYNLNAESMISIAFLAMFVTAALFVPLFVIIANKKSKRFAFNLGMSILALAFLLIFLFAKGNVTLTIVFLFIAGIGMATVFLCPWAMIPDTVEYSQWKTGLRREGILYGFFWMNFKFAAALSGFIVGNVLNFVGYVPDITQTEMSLFGIRLMITVIPIAFIIAGIILISFYPIDATMHQKIVKEIESKG